MSNNKNNKYIFQVDIRRLLIIRFALNMGSFDNEAIRVLKDWLEL